MSTFNAVGVGKSNEFVHCFTDGIWSTIEGSFTVVRDFKDVCFHSYFSIMDDLRHQSTKWDAIRNQVTTEITLYNRPKDAIFDWFFEPLMIIKEQISAENLTEEEENYLSKLVLLNGDAKRLKLLNAGLPSTNERRKAEIEAFARRLQGITKSMSRYPTVRRRFHDLVKTL